MKRKHFEASVCRESDQSDSMNNATQSRNMNSTINTQVAALERAIVDLNVEKHLYVQLNGIIETEWLNSTNLELCVYIGKLCQIKGFAQNES